MTQNANGYIFFFTVARQSNTKSNLKSADRFFDSLEKEIIDHIISFICFVEIKNIPAVSGSGNWLKNQFSKRKSEN